LAGAAAAVALWFLVLCVAAPHVHAEPPQTGVSPSRGSGPVPGGEQPSKGAKAKLGVQVNKPEAFQGYTLVFPLQSTKTYLIDMQGRVVRDWASKYAVGQEAYLLENGHLLRPAKLSEGEAFFAGAAQGGRVQEFTWEGKLLWDIKFHNEKRSCG
jgi:hypothetical protein